MNAGPAAWRRSAGWAFALTLAIIILDVRPAGSPASLTGHHDNATFSYPLRLEAARQWTAGRFPLWNPYSMAGAPLLADITSAALYPGNIPFLFVGDRVGYRALDEVALLHFGLAALFMFVFGRALSLGRAAATIAGLVYAGNGTFLFFAGRWIQMQNTAVWVPLILAAVHRAAGIEGFLLWIGIGAVAVALQGLAGYPQYSFYTAVLAAAYALVLACGRSGKGWRPLIAVAAIYGTGALLAAVQLLPTVELASMSGRGGPVSLKEFLKLAASPDIILGWAVPRAVVRITSPHPAAGAAFMGTLAVVLAVEGGRSLRRERLFLVATLLVAFLLAIGPHTALGEITHRIPVLNAFRYPYKHLLEVTFALAVLAGFGAQSLLEGRRGASTCVVAGALIGVCATSSAMLAHGIRWYLAVAAASSLAVSLLVLAGHRRAAIGLAILSIWAGLWSNREALRSRLSPHGTREPPWALIDLLTDDDPAVLGPRYVLSVRDYGFPLRLLALDYPTQFQVPAVHGTSPFLWRPLGDALGMNDMGSFRDPGRFDRAGQVWDVLAARYVGSRSAIPLGSPILYRSRDGGVVAERRSALPVVRFVDRAECMAPAETALERHRHNYNFAEVALLDCTDRPLSPPVGPARSRGGVELVESTAGLLRLRTRLAEGPPGILVVSQADVPGWRASIDGRPSGLYRAYGLVQALVVPSGDHDVALEYRPASFAIGGRISLATSVVMLLGGACLGLTRRRRLRLH